MQTIQAFGRLRGIRRQYLHFMIDSQRDIDRDVRDALEPLGMLVVRLSTSPSRTVGSFFLPRLCVTSKISSESKKGTQPMIPKECKRLAEVDFPIAVVSEHAAREKSIRHGHPSTLHLWWARRPLASCRAMLMACSCPTRRTSNARRSSRTRRSLLLLRSKRPAKSVKTNADFRGAILAPSAIRQLGQLVSRVTWRSLGAW